VSLGGFQEKVVVRVMGGGDSASEPLDLGWTICWWGSPIRVTRSKLIIPAWWSPGLIWKEHQEEKATGRSWETQIPSIGDLPRDPRWKVASVGRPGCAERIASRSPEGMGTAESSKVSLADVTIDVGHKDDGITCSLPSNKGGREVSEEGSTGTGRVT